MKSQKMIHSRIVKFQAYTFHQQLRTVLNEVKYILPREENLRTKIHLRNNLEKESFQEQSDLPKQDLFSKIYDSYKNFNKSVKKSFKRLQTDIELLEKLKMKRGSEANMQIHEFIKWKETQFDFLKLVPFSFFLWVPFSEFVFPFYLLFLPNSIPSQFLSDEQLTENQVLKLESQNQSVQFLKAKYQHQFYHEFIMIENIVKELKENPYDQDLYRQLQKVDREIYGKISKNKTKEFKKYNSDDYKRLLEFNFVYHFSGLYIINAIVNIRQEVEYYYKTLIKKEKVSKKYAYKLNMNYFPFSWIKRLSYKKQLETHFEKIDREDQLILQNMETLNECTEKEFILLLHSRCCKYINKKQALNFLNDYFGDIENRFEETQQVYNIIRYDYSDYLYRHKNQLIFQNFLFIFIKQDEIDTSQPISTS